MSSFENHRRPDWKILSVIPIPSFDTQIHSTAESAANTCFDDVERQEAAPCAAADWLRAGTRAESGVF